jgi:hypothetical protein
VSAWLVDRLPDGEMLSQLTPLEDPDADAEKVMVELALTLSV